MSAESARLRECLASATIRRDRESGDNGAGIGASHQTGWTGLVACALQISKLTPEAFIAQRR